MLCKFKLNHCCCWRWSNKSEELSDEEKKDTTKGTDIFNVEDGASKRHTAEVEEETDEEGNPRNKVALQPGHSLMDWIRLGSSGKDLTGLGARAGTLTVTKTELAKHNNKYDGWLAIRGKVYCITQYFPFHPGGEEELMRGVGIDASSLFDEVHPWVNYEQILQKCLVGKLVTVDPTINKEALFYGEQQAQSAKTDVFSPSQSNVPSPTGSAEPLEPGPTEPPRFDWIQKTGSISVIFYAKAFSNPLVQVNKPEDDQSVTIIFCYDGSMLVNDIKFHAKISWPCEINMVMETGKVEVVFRKCIGAIWDTYGVLQHHAISVESGVSGSPKQRKSTYVINKKSQVNYNTWMFMLHRKDKQKVIMPIGRHFKIYGVVDGTEMSRSYTPVPESIFDNFLPNRTSMDHNVGLVIKRYSEGKISRFITDKNEEDEIEMSDPLGLFNMKLLEKRETFLMLAAGTGITPMLNLIIFLLERRVKKCQFIRLLFFNRTEKDILLSTQLDQLAETDKRIKINNILSEPSDDWKGLKGHVNAQLIESCLQEHLQDTGYTIRSIYGFICGPPKFNEKSKQELTSVGLNKEQFHVFGG
ncbi:cytochrome b5 reductase 4 isoform X2 [Euwallacea fornicatus]|uniref:cytochrome b5 reductase 4 isoform X2 n=1 Tax=Euwallacea fornicatus TaxID=995702 RepID=UPI00338FCDA7